MNEDTSAYTGPNKNGEKPAAAGTQDPASSPASSPISFLHDQDETTTTTGLNSSQECAVEVYGARKKKKSPIKLPASASLWKDDPRLGDDDEVLGSPLEVLRITYDSAFIADQQRPICRGAKEDYKKIFFFANVEIDQDLAEQISKNQREVKKWLPEKFTIENLDFDDPNLLKLSMSLLKYCIMDVKKSNMTQQQRMNLMPYLRRLKSIFEMCLAQPPIKPDEQTFTSLFGAFTEMAIGYYMPSGGCLQRSMRVCGNVVKSVPVLRMLKVEDDMKEKGCFEVSVVTVGEVKKRPVRVVKDEEEQSGAAGDNVIKRRRLDELKYTFPSDLRGQHAAELLVELPFSAVKSVDNMKHIFGLVIQATKVSLTCLKMTEQHLQELLEDTSPVEVSHSHDAKILYTRPYDMLSAEDRSHLVYILTTLAKLGGHM